MLPKLSPRTLERSDERSVRTLRVLVSCCIYPGAGAGTRPRRGRSGGAVAATEGSPPGVAAREPPIRAGQWSLFPSDERTPTRRLAVRFLSPAASGLPDHRSRPYQESQDRSRTRAKRPGPQSGAVYHQWAARHGSSARESASPTPINAARLEELSGSPSDIVWIRSRDLGLSFALEAGTRAYPETPPVAFRGRVGFGLLP